MNIWLNVFVPVSQAIYFSNKFQTLLYLISLGHISPVQMPMSYRDNNIHSILNKRFSRKINPIQFNSVLYFRHWCSIYIGTKYD